MRKGKTGTHQTELTVERGSEVRGMLKNVLPSKTMLTVNDIALKLRLPTCVSRRAHEIIKNTANYHGNT